MSCMMVSLLFGVALVLLLTQAFKLMRQGMDAANRPMDTIPKGSATNYSPFDSAATMMPPNRKHCPDTYQRTRTAGLKVVK